jgi:hypothetical protein
MVQVDVNKVLEKLQAKLSEEMLKNSLLECQIEVMLEEQKDINSPVVPSPFPTAPKETILEKVSADG